MKRQHLLAVLVLLLLAACSGSGVGLAGAWQADKVSVGFDAAGSTPELVRQAGMIEKMNRIVVAPDSSLTLVNRGDTLLRCPFDPTVPGWTADGARFEARWDGVALTTRERTPFGEITVRYKKQ